MLMKRIAVIAMLLLSTSCVLAQGYNSNEGSHRGSHPNHRPQTGAWSGSGIAIGSRIFATNNHVVANSTHLYAYFPEEKHKFSAKVLCVDVTNDLAIVEVDDTTFKGFPPIEYGFKQTVEEVGEDVFVLGYPLIATMGEEVKLTTGVISARSGFEGNKSQYQISAPIQNGNSGSPLFNGDGELIGIVSAKHLETENVGYGVKLNYLLDLADRNNVKIDTTIKNQLFGKKLSEKCKSIIPCTLMVLADNEMDSREYVEVPKGITEPPSAEHKSSYPFHVNMPALASRSTEAFELYGIELNSSETVLYMTFTNGSAKAVQFGVGKDTYIVDKETGKRYQMTEAKGCTISPKSTIVQPNKSIDFELHFPKLSTDIQLLDLYSPKAIVPLWIYGITIQ